MICCRKTGLNVRASNEVVSAIFARWGSGNNGRTFGFNGHTDVVPVGDISAWSVDPFGAEVKDGFLFGRGATDMKSVSRPLLQRQLILRPIPA